MGKCAGEEFAAFAGMGILSSYLLLFISFYFATYNKDDAKGGRGRKKSRRLSETATRAVTDMARTEVPDVDRIEDAVHKGAHLANGSAKAAVNGGATPRVTRSRKA